MELPDFDALEETLGALPDVLQRSGDAAGILTSILGELKQATAAETAASRLAADMGVTVAEAKRAIAAAAGAATAAEAAHAKAADEAGKALKRQADAAQKAQEATDAARGPERAFGESMMQSAQSATHLGGVLGKVQDYLGKLGPYGQAAAAAIGVVGIVVSKTAGTLVEFFEAAIQVAETRAGLLATFSALGGGEVMGGKTLAMVQRLGTSLPFATSQIAAWGKSLQAAGIQGNELESAIKAVGAAQALMGESGAAATENLLKKLAEGGKGAETLVKSLKEGGGKSNKMLAEMGLTTADLAKALGKTPAELAKMTLSAADAGHAIEKALAVKGKGPLEELGLTFPVMIAKVKEGFTSLFSDLGPSVKPFMAAVKSLFGEFSKGGGVINFLKPIVTSVMATLFAWATKAVTAVHGIVTWLLASGKAGGMFSGVIAVLKGGWAALVAIFGMVSKALAPVISLLKAIFSNAMVLQGIKTIFTIIAGVIVAVIVVIGALVGAFAAAAGFVAGFVGAIVGAVSGMVGAIVEGLSSLDFGAFVAKMGEMAQAGLAAFKSVFGIKSPSSVMLEQGEENIAGATATGVDKGAAKVDKAMAKMGPKEGGKGKGRRGADAGGERHFHYSGPVEHYAIFKDHMDRWWEEMASSGPEPETT